MDEHVIIGMDPHKRTVTIEVMDAHEHIHGHRQFTTDTAGFAEMLVFAQEWPQRTWAVEGCNGIGHHVAERLLLAGEQVVDDARVRWEHPAHAVDRRVRGCTPAPGAWTTAPDGSRLKLGPVVPEPSVTDLAPGAVRATRSS